MISMGIFFFCYFLTIKIDDITYSDNIISKFQDNGNYHYIIRDSNSKGSYSIKSYDEEIKSTDGKLHYKQINPISIILIIIMIFLGVFLFLVTIIDDDTGWEISESWTESKLYLVKCEVEDGIYYYHYKGKLLTQCKHQLMTYEVTSYLRNPINLLPDFTGTKSQKRDNKLDEIFK